MGDPRASVVFDILATLDDDARQTLEARWESFQTTVKAPSRRGETIRPAPSNPRGEGLPASVSRTAPSEGLTFEGTLGEGGMGVVQVALQHSMGRRVAVKTLKTDSIDAEVSLQLLREAWVAGSLEHPNVVPVYDVSVAADGRPIIVMKKIEGASWTALMAEDKELQARVGGRDRMESNLRVLLQVTRAVGLAHERGVIHRDIKPDNVMIGIHGEVYLVDWGIAVSCVPDPTGRLPVLDPDSAMAGTPCYMAPEVASSTAAHRVSTRTDIYLLGGLLYEIVTGRAPHEYGDLRTVLASILGGPPPLPPGTDEELAGVIRRALAKDPADRFPDAATFRDAVETFLVHRDSNRIADSAWERLRELEQVLGETKEDVEHVRKAHVAYGACRFGFAQALSLWPENARAITGRDRATAGMLEFLLATGDATAAQAVMFDAPAVPLELETRVRSAVASAETQARDSQLLLDTKTGARSRLLVSLIMATVWIGAPVAAEVAERTAALSQGTILATHVLEALVALALVAWARETLFRTPLNRRVVGSIAAVLVGTLFTQGTLWALDLPVTLSKVLLPCVWFTALLFTLVTVSVRFWGAALAAGAMVVVRAVRPELSNVATVIANVVFLGNTAYVWRDIVAAEHDRIRRRAPVES
jgi:serine/threonine protein kinase